MRELEQNLQYEKNDYTKKLCLYKDQVKKMRGNIDLFKDSIVQLQQKNHELTTRHILSGNATIQ